MGGELHNVDSGPLHRVFGSREGASFQVIVLGSSGGPREDTVTGLLVRSPQSEWRKSSVIAVDAGAHLASIIAILQKYMPKRSAEVAEPGHFQVLNEGPFAGVPFPFISAKANSLHVFRELLHSFLITHPHLDHIAAMAINTPALEYGREAKAIVALPAVIDAIKAHIFNDAIWPNLSDENHGVGFVTYRRLTEGGNQRLGSGDARGYVSVCDGLATKCLAVTHGKCERRNHSLSHQRGESGGWFSNDYNFPPRRMSRMSDDHNYFAAMLQQQAYGNATAAHMHGPPGPMTPGLATSQSSAVEKDFHHEAVTSSAFFIRNDVTGKEILVFGDIEPDSVSMLPRNHLVWDEAAPKIAAGLLKAIFIECSYDDTVRDADLFGHLCPRHLIVELTALAKRVMTYRDKQSNSQRSNIHLAPNSPQLNLKEPSQNEMLRKRKRGVNGEEVLPESETSPRLRAADAAGFVPPQYVGSRAAAQPHRRLSRDGSGVGGHSPLQRSPTPSRIPRHVQFHGSPRLQLSTHQLHSEVDLTAGPVQSAVSSGLAQPPPVTTLPPQPRTAAEDEKELEILPAPLKGFTVHIIHVKDTMTDGPSPGEVIGRELNTQAAAVNLGSPLATRQNAPQPDIPNRP